MVFFVIVFVFVDFIRFVCRCCMLVNIFLLKRLFFDVLNLFEVRILEMKKKNL